MNVIGVLATLVLALSVATADAEGDGCRAHCEKMNAACVAMCPDAPDPAQCKANCRAVYQGCLSDCADDT